MQHEFDISAENEWFSIKWYGLQSVIKIILFSIVEVAGLHLH